MKTFPHAWARRALAVSVFVCVALVSGICAAQDPTPAPTGDPQWLATAIAILAAVPTVFSVLGLILHFSVSDGSPWAALRDAIQALGFDLVKLYRAIKALTGGPKPPTGAGTNARKIAGLSVLGLVLCAGVATTQTTACKPGDAQTALNIASYVVDLASYACAETQDAGYDPQWVTASCDVVDQTGKVVQVLKLVLPRGQWAAIRSTYTPPDAGASTPAARSSR